MPIEGMSPEGNKLRPDQVVVKSLFGLVRGDAFIRSLSLDPDKADIRVRGNGDLEIMCPMQEVITLDLFSWYCQDKQNAICDGSVSQSKDRIEYNQYFVWSEDLQCWYTRRENLVGGKRSNNVLVFPPSASRSEWWVLAPESSHLDPLIGEDVEKRAFAIAVGYVTQNTGVAFGQ